MNLKYIIGIIAVLILMVGTASAFSITKSNLYEGQIPEGASIEIEATYNGNANTITFVDNSKGLTNPRITWVAYNLDVDAAKIEGSKSGTNTKSLSETQTWVGITGAIVTSEDTEDQINTMEKSKPEDEEAKLVDWMQKNNFGAQGIFGELKRVYAVKNPTTDNHFTKVVMTLKDPGFDGTIPGNSKGNQVGVHFVCDEFSCFVAGPTPPDDPPIPNPEIPEFPTVALPVAAILGLMFIFGRRKKE